jgi:uncharacterized protein YuzE
MQLTYDPRHNIAYLRFRNVSDVQVETIRLSDEVSIDLALDGSIYGVELLNANMQLDAADGHLMIDLAGQRFEVSLPEVA